MLNVSGVAPNAVTAVSVMQACGQSMDLVFGMELHRFVKESGIEIDISLSNSVVAMYAKCGRLDYTRDLFEGMREKDEVTYGAMISGYMDYGFVDEPMCVFRGVENPGLNMWNAVISGMVQNKGVFDLVREMQGSGLSPNPVTLASVLPLFSYFSNLRGGKEVHAYAIRRCYEQNVYVATSVIDAYAKLGYICVARWIFYLSWSRRLIIWTSIISAYAAHGDAGLALACAHSGLVDEAWNIFNLMPSKYGIQPLVEHYACMFGVLCYTGLLFMVLLKWASLLVFEMEPENTGNYMIMANLYSHAGKWKQAGEVREIMKEIGLQKICGSSGIEMSGGLLGFIAKEVSKGRSDEVYALLEGLCGLMREEGYVLQEELDYEIVFS
ncbi:hypothetical protein JHK82_026943 [Glycine max]|nr:hypothetical protein JHK86_027065 [Glycine max]KAG5126108.1 hypothetical protein JHK82_026943 [Glycine max]